MSVKGSTPHSELLAATTIALLTTPQRRVRLDLVREHGSFCAALGRIPYAAATAATAERVLEEIRNAGLEALCMTDPLYPRLLRAAPDPPPVISVWGRLEPDDALGLAIVGSRRATRYGLEMSRRLAGALSSAGLTIVSGLARGIDAAAHRGALDAGGRTIAVLGSGLRNIYPREHQKLAEQVSQNGAVISEFDVDEPPRSGNFPRRNRIITGMTLGTLVVEAALKSGSLVSARLAMEQDRDVFAVPGPALSPNSEGVHALIRDGAKLVTHATDVVEELRPDIRALLETKPRTARTEAQEEELDQVERAILLHLTNAQDAVDVDTLAERADIPIPLALAALSGLEVKGRIWSLAGSLYQAKP
ncbi:MAG: DNA-processing protein DprA [Acidobacteriota bacterium]|nr:MAG: DNA-processing protein DprA [Acidobacteriota bacterium]